MKCIYIKIITVIIAAAMITVMFVDHVYAQDISVPGPSQSGAVMGSGPGGTGGMPGGAGGPGGMPGGGSSTSMPSDIKSVIKAAIYVDGDKITLGKDKVVPSAGVDVKKKSAEGATITATVSHESGVYVKNGGSFTVNNSSISKPSGPLTYGISKDNKQSDGAMSIRAVSSYGINAAMLCYGKGSKWTATGNSKVTLNNLSDVKNIDAGKGMTISYKTGEGCTLKGTYKLAGGGALVPAAN